MKNQRSFGINPDGLVRRLDRHVAQSGNEDAEFELVHPMKNEDKLEAEVELSSHVYETPQGVNPFFYSFRLDALRPINRDGVSLIRVMDDFRESKEDIAYLFAEGGVSFLRAEKPEPYQMWIFRTKKPLVQKNRKELPESKICVFMQGREVDGVYNKTLEKRTDYVKNDSGIWIKRDLSEVLPTVWFFSPGYMDSQLKLTGTG